MAVCLIVTVALRVKSLYDEVQRAQQALTDVASTLEDSAFSITLAQAERVKRRLADADASLTRAAEMLDREPLFGIGAAVPGIDRQVDAASSLVRATRAVTSREATIVSALERFIATRDDSSGADRIAALARLSETMRPEIADLAAGFDEADSIAATIPTQGLLDPLAHGRSQLAARLDQVRPLIAAAKTASTLLPSVMGIDGERTYLVLALDNAEIRPVGGLIVAFAMPSFRDGHLRDLTFRDIQSVDLPDQKTYVAPPAPLADHLLGGFTWQVADTGWWPDFATSAAETRRLFKIETGADLSQGVIAFTPELVDRLLSVVGPVTIKSAGITVHPGETYLLSLEQVEVLNQGQGRKDFLADLASQILDRLYALPPSRFPEVIAALAEAGKRRQIQVLFDDPVTQAAVNQFGWGGPFTFSGSVDRLAIMEANVAPVSKLDVLLTMDHALDVTLAPDGSAAERLVTTYTNHFGPKLAPELERVRSTFFAGNLGSYSIRYIVPGANVTSVSSDDPEDPVTDPGSVEPEGDSLAIGNYQLIRPGTVHLIMEYNAPHVVEAAAGGYAAGGTYRLMFRKQAGRDNDSLTVRVTVPAGMTPTDWSPGGVLDGQTLKFTDTTEFDQVFEVTFAAR